jgi:hypothetical protein
VGITFELFDYERVGDDESLCRGSFNPNLDAFRVGAQEVPVLIELGILPDFKGRSNEPTILTVAVVHLGRTVAVEARLLHSRSVREGRWAVLEGSASVDRRAFALRVSL